MTGHSKLVLSVAVSPNGKQILSGSNDNTAKLWDIPAVEPRRFDARGPIKSFALSDDGTKLATAGDEKILRIWNPSDGKLIREIPAPDHAIVAVAFRQDGAQVAMALANKTVRIVNVADGKEVKKIEALPSPITAMAFRADGSRLAIAGEDKTIRVVGAGDGKTIKELKGHTGTIHALAFAPKDGNLVFSASADKTARLWDTNQGKVIQTYSGHGDGISSLALSRDGAKLVTGSRDKTVRVWNAANGKPLQTIPTLPAGSSPRPFRATTALLAVGLKDGIVKVFDMTASDLAMAERASYRGSEGPATALAFLPDSRTILTGSRDKLVSLWTLPSSAATKTFAGHTGQIYGVAWSPDGKLAATAAPTRPLGSGTSPRGPRSDRSMPMPMWFMPWPSVPRATCSQPVATTS